MNKSYKGSFSDLVANLQSISQSIIFVSIALLLVVFFAAKQDNFSVAIDQLDQLLQFTQPKDWNYTFVSDKLISIADQRDSWYQDYFIEFPVPEYDRSGDEASPTHTVSISAPIFTLIGWSYTGYLRQESEVEVLPPKTVNEFSQLWDKSRTVQVIYTGELMDYAYIQVSSYSQVEKIAIKIPTESSQLKMSTFGALSLGAFQPVFFDLQDIDKIDRNLYGLSPTLEQGYGDNVISKFWIPAKVKPSAGDFTFDASDYLCYGMKKEHVDCQGTFVQIFPELYLAIQDYLNLTFADAKTMLETQREAQLQSFDLLGFKLPASQTSWIGSLTLIILQLYFYILLKALAGIPLQKDFPVWIGLFPGIIPRAAAIASTTLFPFFSIALLNRQWLFFSWQTLPSLSLVVSSVVLSLLIIWNFLSIWEQPSLSEQLLVNPVVTSVKKKHKVVNNARRANRRKL